MSSPEALHRICPFFPLRHIQCGHMDDKVQPLVLHTMRHSSIVRPTYPDSTSVWKKVIKSFTSPITSVTVEPFIYKHIDTNTVNLTYYWLRTAPICDHIRFFCSNMMGVWVFYNYLILIKIITKFIMHICTLQLLQHQQHWSGLCSTTFNTDKITFFVLNTSNFFLLILYYLFIDYVLIG
jgi:hypothetical protein